MSIASGAVVQGQASMICRHRLGTRHGGSSCFGVLITLGGLVDRLGSILRDVGQGTRRSLKFSYPGPPNTVDASRNGSSNTTDKDSSAH